MSDPLYWPNWLIRKHMNRCGWCGSFEHYSDECSDNPHTTDEPRAKEGEA